MLQPEARKEFRHIALGTLICCAAETAVFFLLSLPGWVRFDYRVLLGVAGGGAVAILNFYLMCRMVQKVAAIPDEKKRKARVQMSYNGRLFLQGAWVVVAYLLSCVQWLAAMLPLLFPRLVILFLQMRGYYKAPEPPADEPLSAEETASDTSEQKAIPAENNK